MNKTELLIAIGSAAESDPRIDRAAAAWNGNADPAPLRLFKYGEVSSLTGLSRVTIWRMIKDGKLRTVPVGRGGCRIPESEVRRLARCVE